ncbi:MAG: flagellar hook-length control protein [Pseudomonadota bacterium]
MSIAVRAVIKSSRLLRLLLAAYALANAGAAAALLAGAGVHQPGPLALACLLAALVAGHAACKPEKARVIDVSGLGEIRVTVQQSIGTAPPQAVQCSLLPGSTLWPQCLLLLLRPCEGGAVRALLLVPDSLPAGCFRKLSVAIRAIARRDNKFFRKHKIL